MTTDHGIWRPRRDQRALPPVFDRLVVLLTVQAHLFALFVIVQEWDRYRSGPAVLLLCCFSASIPLVCLSLAQRSEGVLSGRSLIVAGCALGLVDLAGAFSVDSADLGSPAMWTWGVVGVTILTLVPFRPVPEILILAGFHGAAVLAVMLWATLHSDADLFRVLADFSAAVLPALAAAQFVGLYLNALRIRDRVAAQLSAAQTHATLTAAVEADAERRLAWLRAETVPLLAGIRSGEISVSAPGTAVLAQRLSRELRRELLQGPVANWLAKNRSADDTVEATRLDVLDPERRLARLSDADQASLSVFVDALRDNRSWDRLSVALLPAFDHLDQDQFVLLTVVAQGEGAQSAAQNPLVLAAALPLGLTVGCDEEDLLAADATLRLIPHR